MTALSSAAENWRPRSRPVDAWAMPCSICPERPGCGARTARLSVRFGKLDLRPPRETRKTCREAVPMVYVDLREETPPEEAKTPCTGDS